MARCCSIRYCLLIATLCFFLAENTHPRRLWPGVQSRSFPTNLRATLHGSSDCTGSSEVSPHAYQWLEARKRRGLASFSFPSAHACLRAVNVPRSSPPSGEAIRGSWRKLSFLGLYADAAPKHELDFCHSRLRLETTKCFFRLRWYRRSPQEMSPKHTNLIYRTSEVAPAGCKTFKTTQARRTVLEGIQE